ncbi:MAG: Uma2 family endonuclease [bacterium]|nr:Uma2 family endonuclease [bacterium]
MEKLTMIGAAPFKMTLDEFDRWIALPEHDDSRWEYIDGEAVQVVTNNRVSDIAMRIAARLTVYALDHDLGYVTGADGGYLVMGERYIPDAAFMSKGRQPTAPDAAYNPLPPDLAVEVVSPTDRAHILRQKLKNYLAAGTVVWLCYPEAQELDVHPPGQPPRTLSSADTLDGGTVLPGFTLSLRSIFPPETPPDADA